MDEFDREFGKVRKTVVAIALLWMVTLLAIVVIAALTLITIFG